MVSFVLLACAVFFWAGNWAIGRSLRFDAPPVAMAFWRWIVALVVLLPFTASGIRTHWPTIASAWKKLCLLALLATLLQHIPIYIGLRSTAATNGALLNATSPVFIVILSRLFFGDRLRPAEIVGILLSLCGVVWVVSRGDPAVLRALEVNRGDLWTLFATLSWAGYTVCLRWRPPTLPALVFLTTLAMFGVGAMLPVYALELASGANLKMTPESLLGIAYIGVFATVVAYIFWNRGVRQLGSNKAGAFMYLMPVFTAILSVAFLGERLHLYHFVGIVLIFAGIYLASRSKAAA